MNICDKCKKFGLLFNRRYKPEEFIEGKLSSEVWIIGLNPAAEEDWTDRERDAKDLSNYFTDIEKIHPYFKDFKKVSPSLFDRFGKEGGVAHTDLIKCSSKRWPPSSCNGKAANEIIDNCKTHLFKQILSHNPKFIICNGAPVSRHIREILKVTMWLSETAYKSNIDGAEVIVILSGFIGRIDDYSKRRLGYEIESLIEEIGIS